MRSSTAILTIISGCVLFMLSIWSFNQRAKTSSASLDDVRENDRSCWQSLAKLSNNDDNIQRMMNAIHQYKSAVVSGNWSALYEMRTDAYKAVVSKAVFLKYEVKNVSVPVEVLLSLDTRTMGKERVLFHTTYVHKERVGFSHTPSRDMWVFDPKSKTWHFLSNSLCWGTNMEPRY
jgi:hypothetical protein